MQKGVPIRAVSRSIAILQAINRRGPLSMMAIAREGDVPYATAFRIVQTLIHDGLIEQEPVRKHYRPTALVQSLASGYQSESRLVDVARPCISELTRNIGWPVLVSVRVGTQMVVRDCTHAETSLTFDLCHPGFTLPLLESATGLVSIAHTPRDELDNVIRWLPLSGKSSRQLLDETIAALPKIREDGFAAKPCQKLTTAVNKTSSIAVPILSEDRSEAVLTMTYFYAAMKQPEAVDKYLHTLKKSAGMIATKLSETRTAREPQLTC
jgi:IclR family mhp operon transcriptional activator